METQVAAKLLLLRGLNGLTKKNTREQMLAGI